MKILIGIVTVLCSASFVLTAAAQVKAEGGITSQGANGETYKMEFLRQRCAWPRPTFEEFACAGKRSIYKR